MSKRVLITGGAGFIGSHLADELLAHGYSVRVLDNLSLQVHGPSGSPPTYLASDIELVVGDVRDPSHVRRALTNIDAVVHLAAMVGVGQSMYEVAAYTSANTLGTAVLMEALVSSSVEKLVVASSMSIYGEGAYQTADGELVASVDRSTAQLDAGHWEPLDDAGRPLTPVPTPESRPPTVPSVYALSKYDQERLCLVLGNAYGVPTVALRLFNTYGPRQALGNPYTGVLANFASRLLNGAPPLIFEDGEQLRDFVSVHDVVRAFRLAVELPEAKGQVLNVGSSEKWSVREVARRMAHAVGRPEIHPSVTGKYRAGDVRHCFPDLRRAEQVLGYRPSIRLAAGLEELAGWLAGQAPVDRALQARAELEAYGLTR